MRRHMSPRRVVEMPAPLTAGWAGQNLDGVWNLVLSCRRCNRGKQGKSARVPALHFLERLHRRNEYLIGSHHPLRETLMTQTGRTESERRSFLQHMESFAMEHLVSRWEPSDELRPVI